MGDWCRLFIFLFIPLDWGQQSPAVWSGRHPNITLTALPWNHPLSSWSRNGEGERKKKSNLSRKSRGCDAPLSATLWPSKELTKPATARPSYPPFSRVSVRPCCWWLGSKTPPKPRWRRMRRPRLRRLFPAWGSGPMKARQPLIPFQLFSYWPTHQIRLSLTLFVQSTSTHSTHVSSRTFTQRIQFTPKYFFTKHLLHLRPKITNLAWVFTLFCQCFQCFLGPREHLLLSAIGFPPTHAKNNNNNVTLLVWNYWLTTAHWSELKLGDLSLETFGHLLRNGTHSVKPLNPTAFWQTFFFPRSALLATCLLCLKRRCRRFGR